MPPPAVEYFPIPLTISTHPAFINRYETILRDAAKTLRDRWGQVRLLYYAGLPPPDITLACLFPCSVRQLAPHLFISDGTVHPRWLSFKRAWTTSSPLVAEAALWPKANGFCFTRRLSGCEVNSLRSCNFWTNSEATPVT